jgi:hypothetical protein
MGNGVAYWLRRCATSRTVPGSIPGGVTGFFIFPSDRKHGPEVESALSENEYKEHFLGVKAVGAWGWRAYRFHMPNVMKSGSLNLLEPSGPHRACYVNPLPLPFTQDVYPAWRHVNDATGIRETDVSEFCFSLALGLFGGMKRKNLKKHSGIRSTFATTDESHFSDSTNLPPK